MIIGKNRSPSFRDFHETKIHQAQRWEFAIELLEMMSSEHTGAVDGWIHPPWLQTMGPCPILYTLW